MSEQCLETKNLPLAYKVEELIPILRIGRNTAYYFFYNKAWALLRRNQSQDYQAAKECIRLAICVADGLGRESLKEYFVEFMQSNFDD